MSSRKDAGFNMLWIRVLTGLAVLASGLGTSDFKSSSSYPLVGSSIAQDELSNCSSIFDNVTIETHLSALNGTTWYEVMRSNSSVDGDRCRSVFVLVTSNTTLELTLAAYFPWSNEDNMTESTASLEYYPERKIFSYKSSRLKENDYVCLSTLMTDNSSYWIVGTTYGDDYYISVLSKNRSLEQSTRVELEEILNTIPKANGTTFANNSQDGCVGNIASGCSSNEEFVKNDFDINQFLGSWYILYHSSPEYVINCTSHIFQGSGDALAFFQRYLRDDNSTGGTQKFITEGGPAVIGDSGKLCTTIAPNGEGKPLCQNYWVLDTDYVSYAVVKTCSTLKYNISVEPIMILSRDHWLNEEQLEKAYSVLANANYSAQSLSEIHFGKCLRDRCPMNWATKQHFDRYQFSGDWVEVMTYNQPNNSVPYDNFCSISRYTATINNSIFIQKGVFNETLGFDGTIVTGEFRPIELLKHDGRFVLSGFIQEDDAVLQQEHFHFILDTSYKNWTVIMKCIAGSQLGDPVSMTMSVLLRQGVAFEGYLVDQVMKVVEEKYNVNVTSFTCSDHDCEFPICMHASQGMTPFNVEKYLGSWFVIRETPSQNATGWCSIQKITENTEDSYFSVNFTQYNMSSGEYETEELNLNMTNSTVGNFLEIKKGAKGQRGYSVLYTDYETMALVYICSSAEERVLVLSRETTLSARNEIIILDAIINNNLDASLLNDNIQGLEHCPVVRSSSQTRKQYPFLLLFSAQIAIGWRMF